MTDLQGPKYSRLGTNDERIVFDCQLLILNSMHFLGRPKRALGKGFGGFNRCREGFTRDNRRNLLPCTTQPRKPNVKAPLPSAKRIRVPFRVAGPGKELRLR